MMKLSTTSVVLLISLVLCGKIEARVGGRRNKVRGSHFAADTNSRNLKKDKAKKGGKQSQNNNSNGDRVNINNLQQHQQQQQQQQNININNNNNNNNKKEKDQSFRDENESLLSCLNDNMVNRQYVPTVSAFAREDCRTSYFDYLIGSNFWPWFDKDNERESLTELLTCVGNSVGCEDGGVNSNGNNPQDRNDDPEQGEQQGQGDDSTENLFNCIGNGLRGDGSVSFNFDVFECVADLGSLDEIVQCIGNSMGCDDFVGQQNNNNVPGDRNDDPDNNSGPIPLYPFPNDNNNNNNNGLVPGLPMDRNDDPNPNRPIPLHPFPQPQDNNNVPVQKTPSSERQREHKTLGDAYDSLRGAP